MKTVFGLLIGLTVLGLGFWAYQENYKTREAQGELRAVQRDIVEIRERMTVLRAEWAWLNRPERLRALVAANSAELGLMNMAPEHFGLLEQVAYPAKPVLSTLTPPEAAQ